MKKYLKNKNFIPRDYVDKNINSKNKGNRRGMIYLVIINLIIFPIVVEQVFEKEEIIEIEKTIPIEEIHKDVIINWINEIDKEVISIKVENNTATMIVKSEQKIYDLEEKGVLSINNITKNEKGYYILDIMRKNK